MAIGHTSPAMAQALLTSVAVGIIGLVVAAIFGFSGPDIARHIAFGFFSTMVLLLAHSMMMFYLIGKGKAVKEATAEGGLAGDYYRRVAVARKPVFSVGTLAMAVTMVAAILGASVDTGVLPPIVHATIRLRRDRLQPRRDQGRDRRARRIETRRGRGQPPARLVTAPILSLSNIVKDYRGLRPLRIEHLEVGPGDRVAIGGLDQPAAEVLVNLVTGATLPESGSFHVFGRATSAIADSAEWLAIADRFGIVSERAVLLEGADGAAEPGHAVLARDRAPLGGRAVAGRSAGSRGGPQRGGARSAWSVRLADRPGCACAWVAPWRSIRRCCCSSIRPRACDRADVPGFARAASAIASGRGMAALLLTADEALLESSSFRVLELHPATGRLRERRRRWFRRP